MERKNLQQLLASAQQELNRLTTKQKSLTRKETTHKKIVLGGEVAKYLGLDINHDMLVGFLLTFVSSTDVQRKTWLSNGARARENENLRKEQKSKNYIKKTDHEKNDTSVHHESENFTHPDAMIKHTEKGTAMQLNNTFSAMLEKKLAEKKNKNE
ncbi:conjugal transfer protein TraD [Enterobacteriaceae bacterium EKM102V]|uniref:conjugal transfer protein TraD n=1 Tax=Pantoea TaxID=53335 RepID=UPI00142E0DBB|nr:MULTISPECIES: conjugal transfer protein TraD [Pantoea]KAF6662751.1 conjugal transfer protein TraD [Enterobacteriaceae bacterium EKM102V]KAF6671217.1 conjugal transfer protein TraD [Pantoea sp. EKM103V]